MRPAGNLAGVEFLAPPLYEANAPLWSYIISNSGYFFTKSAVRFFNSRVAWSSLVETNHGALFITSEQDSNGAWNYERRYTVHAWSDKAGVSDVGNLMHYKTLNKARAALKQHLTEQTTTTNKGVTND